MQFNQDNVLFDGKEESIYDKKYQLHASIILKVLDEALHQLNVLVR